MPGLLEEVLLPIQAGPPVFLSVIFCGVSKVVIDSLQRQRACAQMSVRHELLDENRSIRQKRP